MWRRPAAGRGTSWRRQAHAGAWTDRRRRRSGRATGGATSMMPRARLEADGDIGTSSRPRERPVAAAARVVSAAEVGELVALSRRDEHVAGIWVGERGPRAPGAVRVTSVPSRPAAVRRKRAPRRRAERPPPSSRRRRRRRPRARRAGRERAGHLAGAEGGGRPCRRGSRRTPRRRRGSSPRGAGGGRRRRLERRAVSRRSGRDRADHNGVALRDWSSPPAASTSARTASSRRDRGRALGAVRVRGEV